jgi:hypothetical protein
MTFVIQYTHAKKLATLFNKSTRTMLLALSNTLAWYAESYLIL